MTRCLTLIPGIHHNHFELLGPKSITNFFKDLYVSEIFYTLTLLFAKYSILAFCWRLFGSTASIRLPIYFVGGITTLHGIAIVSSLTMTIPLPR